MSGNQNLVVEPKIGEDRMAILTWYIACRHGNIIPHTNYYGNQ